MEATFAARVRAEKGVKARNMIPSSDSIPELEEVLRVDTRSIVQTATKSRIRALRKAEARAAEDGATAPPEPEAEEPTAEATPIERIRVDDKETKQCPKCHKTGVIGVDFGVRNMKRTRKDGTEVVTKRAQAQCKKCRGKKKPKAKTD